MAHSIIEYFGHDSGNPCGYCKQENSSLSHGMWLHRLSCQDYEDLLNRGWRRSGKYCYKPLMNKTCCPQYTIRCDVGDIKLSKSQKKVIKRFNAFLATGKRPTFVQDDTLAEINELQEHGNVSRPVIDSNDSRDDSELLLDISMDLSSATGSSRGNSEILNVSRSSELSEISEGKLTKNTSKGPDPDKPPCRKAKDIRRERKLKKIAEKNGVNYNPNTTNKLQSESKEKTIEEFIEDIPANAKHKFEVKIVCCCPQSPGFQKSYIAECELFKKYQISIHKETPEDCDEKQFRRFLVDGPLQPVTNDDVDRDDDIPSTGLGAFHQQYFIDDKLVAVGVMDILPHCVSSKYFFYDPDYSFLSIGTYSALREIYFVRSLQQDCPSMKYYYMGYYIHNCTKMKYKGQYNPSYLLCPEVYSWQPIRNCVLKLDKSRYSRLDEDQTEKSEPVDVMRTLVLHKSRAMPCQIFLKKIRSSEVSAQIEQLTEYSNLAGIAASRMLLFRS